VSRPIKFNGSDASGFIRGLETLANEMRLLREATEAAPQRVAEAIGEYLTRPQEAAVWQMGPITTQAPCVEPIASAEPPSAPESPSEWTVIPPPKVGIANGKVGAGNAVLYALLILNLHSEADLVQCLTARGYAAGVVGGSLRDYIKRGYVKVKDDLLHLTIAGRSAATGRAKSNGVGGYQVVPRKKAGAAQ
jgi:hypothetical protein